MRIQFDSFNECTEALATMLTFLKLYDDVESVKERKLLNNMERCIREAQENSIELEKASA